MYPLKWWLQKEWSCPVHDHDVHATKDPWDDESECLDCRVGGYRTVYDEEGWAILNFAEDVPYGVVFEDMARRMLEAWPRDEVFLARSRHEELHKKVSDSLDEL